MSKKNSAAGKPPVTSNVTTEPKSPAAPPVDGAAGAGATESASAGAPHTLAAAVASAPNPGEGDPEGAQGKRIAALWVRAIPEQGFRRAGFGFTTEGVGIVLSALTDAQIEALEKEPNLIVQETWIDADEVQG